MDEDKKQAGAEKAAVDEAARAAQLKALEGRLIALLRRKYQIYWRRKESAAAPADGGLEELHRLQDEIKSVFDEIRLIDRKYVVPPFRMFE